MHAYAHTDTRTHLLIHTVASHAQAHTLTHPDPTYATPGGSLSATVPPPLRQTQQFPPTACLLRGLNVVSAPCRAAAPRFTNEKEEAQEEAVMTLRSHSIDMAEPE